jgi:hypothetical protein
MCILIFSGMIIGFIVSKEGKLPDLKKIHRHDPNNKNCLYFLRFCNFPSLETIVCLVWSNYGFLWCEYDFGISSNAFTYAFAYSNDLG